MDADAAKPGAVQSPIITAELTVLAGQEFNIISDQFLQKLPRQQQTLHRDRPGYHHENPRGIV